MGEFKWDNKDRKQALERKEERKARKKGRKKEINCTPTLSSSFVPTWVLLIISRLFQ